MVSCAVQVHVRFKPSLRFAHEALLVHPTEPQRVTVHTARNTEQQNLSNQAENHAFKFDSVLTDATQVLRLAALALA